MTDKTVDNITNDHIDRLVMDGTVTVNEKGSQRDIGIYLKSARFTQFQQSIHSAIAKHGKIS